MKKTSSLIIKCSLIKRNQISCPFCNSFHLIQKKGSNSLSNVAATFIEKQSIANTWFLFNQVFWKKTNENSRYTLIRRKNNRIKILLKYEIIYFSAFAGAVGALPIGLYGGKYISYFLFLYQFGEVNRWKNRRKCDCEYTINLLQER